MYAGEPFPVAFFRLSCCCRPRGWHLDEAHVLVDKCVVLALCIRIVTLFLCFVVVCRQPMSGSLFDFGLYFFHNAQNVSSTLRPDDPFLLAFTLSAAGEARQRAILLPPQDGVSSVCTPLGG